MSRPVDLSQTCIIRPCRTCGRSFATTTTFPALACPWCAEDLREPPIDCGEVADLAGEDGEAIEAASGRLGPDARASTLQALRDYRGPSQFEVYQEDAIPLAARVAIVLLALALAAHKSPRTCAKVPFL